MSRRSIRRGTLWLIGGVVILGCASPVLVTPPPAVTVPGSIETTIAQTAGAAQIQTANALPTTSVPTATLVPLKKTGTISPTPTGTVLFITDTSLPAGLFAETQVTGTITTGTAFLITGTPGTVTSAPAGDATKTRVPKEWNCRVLSKSPANNLVMKGGSSFKATWTVENIGTKTWPKKGVDVVYHSGAHLHTGKPYFDIPDSIAPGDTVTITITMTVPKYPKTYSTRWSLRVGSRDFCSVRYVFEVK